MPYTPSVRDNSEILAQGMSALGSGIGRGIKLYQEKKQEKELIDSTVAAIQQKAASNPQVASALGLADVKDTKAIAAGIKALGGGDAKVGAQAAQRQLAQLGQAEEQQKVQQYDMETVGIGLRALQGGQDPLDALSGRRMSPDVIKTLSGLAAQKQEMDLQAAQAQKARADAYKALQLEQASPEKPTDRQRAIEAEINKIVATGRQPTPAEVAALHEKYSTVRQTTEDISPGYRKTADGGGWEPIPGSEPFAKREKEREMYAGRIGTGLQRAEIVSAAVKEVLPKIDSLTSGLPGTILKNLPGTKAADAAAILDTIKANIGFEQLQTMRKESPTGGALGQVAVQELEMLQATLANLNTNQTAGQLKSNLRKVEEHYRRYIAAEQAAARSLGIPLAEKAAGTKDDIFKQADAIIGR